MRMTLNGVIGLDKFIWVRKKGGVCIRFTYYKLKRKFFCIVIKFLATLGILKYQEPRGSNEQRVGRTS